MSMYTDLITVRKEVTLKDFSQLMFGEQLLRGTVLKRNSGGWLNNIVLRI